jgi:hypothetical protein
MRIVSFPFRHQSRSPSASAMTSSVSHEATTPRGETRPAVVGTQSAGGDDTRDRLVVSTQIHVGGSIYAVDVELLRFLEPDVILAQGLCEVCAPSGTETERAIQALDGRAKVVTLAPRCLREIQENLRQLAELTDRAAVSETLIASQNERMARLANELRGAPRRRVFFLEWIDPIFCGGHWVPEMIELAERLRCPRPKGGRFGPHSLARCPAVGTRGARRLTLWRAPGERRRTGTRLSARSPLVVASSSGVGRRFRGRREQLLRSPRSARL